MPGLPLLSRVPKHFVKTITFTGLTGAGLINESIAVATVTGRVLIQHLAVHCSTILVDSTDTATISLGTTSTVGGLIAATVSTAVDANEFWHDTSPEANVGDALTDKTVNESIIIDCLLENTDGGVLEISMFWLPLSVDGNIA